MSHAVLRIERLPAGALEAAAEFHGQWLADARAVLTGDCTVLTIVLPPAPYDHTDWRRATARDLGRVAAPKRVNVVAGEGEAVERALAYLAAAPGVTGQYLTLAGADAEKSAE